jgi:hypothetical protein
MSRTEVKVLVVLFVFAIVGGAIAGTNPAVRKLFGQKFETYKYPSCQSVTCSVEFYIGSKIEPYSPPAPPGEKALPAHNYLISPTFEGKNKMYMRIDIDKIAAASTAAGKGLLAVYGNCSGNGLKPAFTQNLPNFGGNVVVCASPAKIGSSVYVLGYTAVFQSPKTGSFVIVGINENVEFNSKGQISNQVFDMSKYQSDIQNILTTIDVKSK